MIGEWTIKGFASGRGDSTVIDEWQRSAPPKAVAKFDQRLGFLKHRPVADWSYDYAHALTDANGIWEIKFEWMNIAHRPLFCFGPFSQEITILLFAQERGGKWKPPNSLEIAKARKRELEADAERAAIYDD